MNLKGLGCLRGCWRSRIHLGDGVLQVCRKNWKEPGVGEGVGANNSGETAAGRKTGSLSTLKDNGGSFLGQEAGTGTSGR